MAQFTSEFPEENQFTCLQPRRRPRNVEDTALPRARCTRPGKRAGGGRDDLTRETKFREQPVGRSCNHWRFEPRERRSDEVEARAKDEARRRRRSRILESAGLDCYRWDGRESLAVSRECQFDFRNAGRRGRNTVKYTTNATGATRPEAGRSSQETCAGYPLASMPLDASYVFYLSRKCVSIKRVAIFPAT